MPRTGLSILTRWQRVSLPLQPASVLGQPISEVLASWGSFLQRIKETNEPQIEILSRENPARYYDLHVKPLFNKSKQLRGRLFAFRDVTHYRQTEDQLARQNEELKIIEKD